MSPLRFSTRVQVRIPEVDLAGIVYHGLYFGYFELARADYFKNLGVADVLRPSGLPAHVVHAEADYKSPARFDEVLVLEAGISEIGRTSYTFQYRVTGQADGRLVAEGRTVHVTLDMETWKPVPIPEAFRRLVRSFEGPSLEEKP